MALLTGNHLLTMQNLRGNIM